MLMPRQSAIESLIQLTLDQAKRRRRPTDLKDIHNELIELHREFKDLLPELADRGIATKPIDYLFDTLVVSAYLLGSASPNPKTDRTAKAVMARQNMRKEQPALPPWKEYVINRLPTMKKNTALARAKLLRRELKNKKKIKPPALSTVRQFVGQVDRQRAKAVNNRSSTSSIFASVRVDARHRRDTNSRVSNEVTPSWKSSIPASPAALTAMTAPRN
jgi:hypothetical protein